MEVSAQPVALNRPPLFEAVSPPPREIVEPVRPASLKLEDAVASLPARAAKSNVTMSCAVAGTTAAVQARAVMVKKRQGERRKV